MNSIRTRLLVLLVALIVLAALAVGAVTYRSVLREVKVDSSRRSGRAESA